jgi:hypothetical protein
MTHMLSDHPALSSYPLPLRKFLNAESRQYSDSPHVSFSYAAETGALQSQIARIDDFMQRALGYRGKEQATALKLLAALISEVRAEHDLIDSQWTDELKRREARRAACSDAAMAETIEAIIEKEGAHHG